MSYEGKKIRPACPRCGDYPSFRSQVKGGRRHIWVSCQCGLHGDQVSESTGIKERAAQIKEARRCEDEAVKGWRSAVFNYRLEELGLRKPSGIEYRDGE